MQISYLLDVLMGLAVLMVVAICAGENELLSLHDLASFIHRTKHVSTGYLLAAILLALLAIRSISLLACASRQLMAIGRYSDSKGLSFLGETDGSPAPRSALIVLTILTGSLGLLTLLRDYRVVVEQARRLGALCTLFSYLVCIGPVCIYRLRTSAQATTIALTVKRRTVLLKALRVFNSLFALVVCGLLFISISLPPTLPVGWRTAPWSLLAWVCAILLLSLWYWRSGRYIFVVRTVSNTARHSPRAYSPVDASSMTTKEAAAKIEPLSDKRFSLPSSEENSDTTEPELLERIPTPEWLKQRFHDLERGEITTSIKAITSVTSSGDQRAHTNASHQSSWKGKARAFDCQDPANCSQGAPIPDVGSSKAVKPLCHGCRIRQEMQGERW